MVPLIYLENLSYRHNIVRFMSLQICDQFSLHATSLSKHVAVCTALVCGAQCSMPARLGHWQSQTSSIWSEMTGQWSDRSAMTDCKTLSPPGPMSYLYCLALRIWISFWRRDRWYGHVECSNGAVKTAFDIQVDGKRGPGRPKMTWKQLTERDYREWKLSSISPHDRHTWRSGVRSALRAAFASYLEWGPLVWMLPLYLHINKKSDYDIWWWYEFCIKVTELWSKVYC